jgi:hypothetical protein
LNCLVLQEDRRHIDGAVADARRLPERVLLPERPDPVLAPRRPDAKLRPAEHVVDAMLVVGYQPAGVDQLVYGNHQLDRIAERAERAAVRVPLDLPAHK